jgi:ribonuclease Y
VLVAAGILIGLVLGGVLGVVIVRTVGASRFDKAMRARQQLLQDAEREAEAMRREAHVEAREEAVKLRAQIDGEVNERRAQLARAEERLQSRDEELQQKLLELSRREQGLADREDASKALHSELKETKQQELRPSE